jgi:hypothetical protein
MERRIFNNFDDASIALAVEGFKNAGQDNRLGHIFDHPDGRRMRVVGGFAGGYEAYEVVAPLST